MRRKELFRDEGEKVISSKEGEIFLENQEVGKETLADERKPFNINRKLLQMR